MAAAPETATSEEDREPGELCRDLSSRDLTEVPLELFQSENITSLYLDFNDIESLPEQLDKLVSLKVFSMIGNNLTTLPMCIGNIAALEEMYLSENDITKLPDSVCKLKRLRKMLLTGNHLEVLPDAFGEIESLQCLNCEENKLQKLPKTFGLLENLVELELSCNSIESLSEGFGMLKSLQVLNLSSNKLEALPESFGNLASLRTLDMSANNIKFLPEHFKSCHCLEKFYFESNLLQTLPSWVSQLENIIEFSVKDNQFQNQALPDEFPKGCQRLKVLDMSGNFMDALPSDIGILEKLEFIHLGSVIGELERRNFQNGNWLAEIPGSLCNLKNLRELHLDENQINELPQNFGDLECLEILDMGQNLLHTLPDSFGRLKSLRNCVLSKNHLMWLPSNFGDLSALEDLRLDDNELAELPHSFARLTQLKTLDLFSNRLTEIPSALPHLTNLVRLDVEANDFSLPLTDIPMIMTRTNYPERDPNLSDNWRGRLRQDLTDMGDVIKVESGTGLGDFEPPPKDLPFSDDFLIAALKQNASIWKSHGDTTTERRRPYRRRPQPKDRRFGGFESEHSESEGEECGEEDSVDEKGDNSSEYDNDGDTDDDFEPPVVIEAKTWSGTKPPEPPTEGTHVDVTAMLEETECWDDEIEANTAIYGTYDTPVIYQHPTKIYYPPIDNGGFTFAPFDIHEDDYVKKPGSYGIEDGQFDGCDDDNTEQVCVDPVF